MNLICRFLLTAISLFAAGTFARAEVIVQYFETRWDEIYERLPEIAEIGYESIWTPPPGKSPIGGPYPHAYGGNVGYNSYDRFDLGDHPQRGHWETRYGSRTSMRNMVDNAHQMDLKIYPDIVFNHTGNGPDYRTYPGMVPQDFHVWVDPSQPGGFKRAPRMFEWSPDNGYGGTLHQELVSLMDIVLEFDGRFQGNNGPRYAADPTPFVRHPGDPEKYPYFNQTGFVTENSRQFITRWINWLGYAMDYDGVRLDAPKHVAKEYFGLPNQNSAERDQSLIYNIQKNFNERRGLNDSNPFDDMYSNYIRRDDALVYSEFFIGSIGETDYWRNPSDRNWGIQTRYLDFPRKSQMIMAAFNSGNLAALDNTTAGFSPEEGVIFAHSHDEDPPGKLELAYAYILTRVGTPVVYFTGNNLADNEDKEENGITWMRKGYDGALGDKGAGTIPNLIYIHNQFARGREWTRWAEGDFFAFERYEDLNSNGQPNSGEGLLLTVLNDSGSDQTRNGIQTSFAPGTILKDYTGRNTNTVTVGSDGKVNITVGGWWGQGFGCWAPFNAEGPSSGPAIAFAGSGVSSMPWVIPGGRDAVSKPRTVTRVTGNEVTINVNYREPTQGGETVNSGILKWGQGRNLNASAADIGGKDIVNAGYEQMTKVGPGQYQLVADLTGVPEGLHTIKARLFNGRAEGRPALYQTFTTTVYVDRSGPSLAFSNLEEGETVEGARVVTVENADRTLRNLTYTINGGPSQQADQVIQGRWRIALDGLPNGANSITLNATEADRGATPATVNTSTLTRNFTVDTTGQSIAINHASGATIAEPFFKTVVTVPTGQGITASDIKLFWNGYEQPALVENPAGSGKFESTFTGRYREGGVDKIFYGAFVNGPNFFEAVVTKNGQENRVARRVVFNLYGQNLHDSDGDGLPDDIELNNFLSGRNPGPNRALPGDGAGLDNIPNYGEQWSRLNPMNAETFYNGQWDGDRDSDGDGVSNLQELIRGFRINGNVYSYDMYNGASIPPASIDSFASSSLSMSGGNKIVTITYRPNEGPLANAQAVTVNVTPVGGGTAQSFTMTGGPTEFTYSYTVPSGATAVNFTFSNDGTTDTSGGASWSASTSAAFVMDGQFDSQNFVVSDNGMRIYAAIRGNKLYTATWSPKGGANDHVIYITDEFGNPVTAGPATGSDSASNYTTWANGNNQGSGFGTWAISNTGSVSGAFLGDPAAAGIQGMSSKSFGLYAKGGAGSSATAIRSFPALNVGDSIAFQWGINWDAGSAGGNKGFNLWADTTHLLNVENAGNNNPVINVAGTSSGMAYGTQAMNWSITRTSATTLDVRATRRDGGVFTRTVTVNSSAPTRLEFYASNLSDGDQRQPYFNDLRIYRNSASAKGGLVYGNFNGSDTSKPWLFSTPNVASQYGFKTSGRNWLGNQGAALEGEVDLVEAFGSVPRILYVSAVAYSGGFGGTIQSQAPPVYGNSANDLEIPEYQPLNTASIRDEDLDGRFDVGNPEMIVVVNGNETDGNYGLRRFYLDEVAGDTSELTVKFKPNTAVAPTQVEVYTNLNRRDFAVLEEDPSTVTTSSNTYFRGYTMSGPNAEGYYTATLPVNLCGAYRLQVRYKVPGVNGGDFTYYTDNGLRRDCAVVVSPKKSLELNMYEVNPLIVEAKDTTEAGRSTFLDLVNDPSLPGEAGGYDGRPDALNKNHYASLGVNMLWLQPIHPIGVEGRDINPETPGQPFNPGSPYAVRDYWSVAPMLGRANTPASADAEFQTFVQRLDQWGVGVMMDGTFNHSAPDVVMGKGAVDLGITGNAAQEIRDFNTGWYAKEGFPGTPASTKGEIAIAPDRNDFGNWTDVREFYFGDYDALVKEKGTQNPDKSYPDNAYKLAFLLERDDFAGHTPTTRQVWDYFAYYPIFWLEKSGHTASTPKDQSDIGIDGLRCDFAQGLPSQFWEYAINKTRSRKWNFVFMAESLDGARTVGNSSRHGVGYRSARHFDVLNENIVFYWRDTFFGYPANGGAGTAKNPNTFDTWKAYDDRRNSFDNVTLLNNLVSHDEVFPHNDVWRLAYGYAQTAALDGIPMLMYGQEAGAQNSKAGYGASETNFGTINAANNFGKYEQNFGKNIPNFKVYNDMSSIWNNRTEEEWRLQDFYGRMNRARLNARALMSQNVYYLSKKQAGGGYDDSIFAVGKVQNLGQAAGGANSVVFAFVNNNHSVNPNVSATYDLNAKAPGTDLNYFGIDRGRNYNVRDLLADNSNSFVWPTNRTGADLIDNGLFVGLPNTTAGTGSHQAQYLQLVDVSTPTLSFVAPSTMTFGTTNTLTATATPPAPVIYSLIGGDTDKVTLNGDQLVINSGTGSVTVRAVVEATADRPGVTNEVTITFAKGTPVITVEPTASAITVGQVLSDSTLSGGTASVPGTFAWSSQDGAPTSSGDYEVTFTPSDAANYDSVTTMVNVQVSPAGTAFSAWSEGADLNSANLIKYAIGGASGLMATDGVQSSSTISGPNLVLTAIVRTDDPKLTVVGEVVTNLADYGTAGSITTVQGVDAPDQTGVPAGCKRQSFTVQRGTDSKKFLRLKATLAP
ncbi:MAG: alpha-amylase domain-containing protein [Luteolibacter sp.]